MYALKDYGASPPPIARIPTAMRDTLLMNGVGGTYQTQQRIPDFRRYEIKDHLGNVRTVISDVKNPDPTYTSSPIQFWKYLADVKNISNIYPYGKLYGTNAIYNASEDYRYGFNGMEKEKNIDASGDITDFGARVFDANFPMFLSRDPLERKFVSYSSYSYVVNNPIYFVDIDGREPIPFYRKFTGKKRKAWQWYYTGISDRLSIWHKPTFHSAAIYSTENLRASTYETVFQRSSYYEWVQSQLDAKGYATKWFSAASIVTSWDGVGGVDIPDWELITTDATDNFLRGTNEFLLPHNMKNAKSLLSNGELSGTFIDGNGKEQSFDGLSGIDLDKKMVEFEQSKVQEYIDNYNGNDLDDIMDEINWLMSTVLPDSRVKDVLNKEMNGKIDFRSYDQRVKLANGVIDRVQKK
jgi:RHS repeat-associated protein